MTRLRIEVIYFNIQKTCSKFFKVISKYSVKLHHFHNLLYTNITLWMEVGNLNIWTAGFHLISDDKRCFWQLCPMRNIISIWELLTPIIRWCKQLHWDNCLTPFIYCEKSTSACMLSESKLLSGGSCQIISLYWITLLYIHFLKEYLTI